MGSLTSHINKSRYAYSRAYPHLLKYSTRSKLRKVLSRPIALVAMPLDKQDARRKP